MFVLAVGSPMWDTQACVAEEFLGSHDLLKGDAKLISDKQDFERLKHEAQLQASRPVVQSCGGCTCNSVKVLSCLGYDVGLCGAIGKDTVADQFRKRLSNLKVNDLTAHDDVAGTGEVLCLVTPDNERTFAYRPGASATLVVSALSVAMHLQPLILTYFDAYTLLCPGRLPEEGMKIAQELGSKVALNLGSAGIVSAHQNRIWELLRNRLVNAIMMNETEAIALCEMDDEVYTITHEAEQTVDSTVRATEKACSLCSQFCDLTVVTLGATGIWVANGQGAPLEFHGVTPMPVEKVADSTGAGDYFAGGFLGAWLKGHASSKCCTWGSLAAVEVLQCFGTDLCDDGWARIRTSCQ